MLLCAYNLTDLGIYRNAAIKQIRKEIAVFSGINREGTY